MKLSQQIEKGKRLVADYLNGISEKFSLQTKKRILAMSGFLIGCICLAMMVEPFRNPVIDRDLTPHETTLPIVIVPPDNEEPLISQEEFSMLADFKEMMDSLNMDDPASYKEILNGREGLMDSINFLIKLYRNY